MRAGQIVQAGKADDLYRRPHDLAAARFFCDFTEIEGRVRGGRLDTPLGLFRAPGLPEGAAGIACIRPQAVRLRAGGFCIPGRVMSRRFLGELDLLEIAVQGTEAPIKARLRGHPAAIAGKDVGIDIDADEVLVFAAPEP
jgi:iron(III) transport system ATP-binding protein